MDTDENIYISKIKQMTLSEITESFMHLKHIGIDIEQIKVSAQAYYTAYHKDHDSTCNICGESFGADGKVYNTSIPWRKELMENATATFSEVSKDQVQTDLSQSVVSQHSSS